MAAFDGTEPVLAPELVQRVVQKLGLAHVPSLNLAGLNRCFAAYCGNIPNDNIRKRLWLVGDRTTPVAGGEPVDFFESWLIHGTGGTCFPTNGALCALLRAIGFEANRIAGSIVMGGIEQDGNHGSVLVTIDGVDYLVDAQLASFKALPLIRGWPASTGGGIHNIRAIPIDGGFDVECYPGSNRETPLIMRPDLNRGPVGHDFFLTHYELSARTDRNLSPFNEALFASRRFPRSILIVGRGNRIDVSADNAVTRTAISPAERTRVLIEEMGISEEMANAIPPDDGGT